MKDNITFCKRRIISLIESEEKKAISLNPQILFKKIWATFKYNHEFTHFLDKIETHPFNTYRLDTNARLHLLILMILKGRRINYFPNIRLHDDSNIKSAIASKKSSMLIGIHDGFAFGAALLHQYNQQASIITSDPFIGDTLWRTGLRPDQVNLITQDFRCLERLRLLSLKGVIPTNCVDYINENNVFYFINPNLFQFAILHKFSVYFLKNKVGTDGIVDLEIAKLTSTMDPMSDAQIFANFQTSLDNPLSPKKYIVKPL